MASQERAVGQGISALSAVSAPPRSPEAPPTTIPKRETEPTPVHPEPQPRPTKRSLFQRMTTSLALRILLLGGTVASVGGYALYREVPAVRQAVDQQAARFGLIEVEAVVPPTYDNKASIQKIKAGVNAVAVTNEQLQEIFTDSIKPLPVGDRLPNNVSILFPVAPAEGQTIEISKHNVLNGSPQANPPGTKLEVIGIDTLITVDKGTQVIVPVERAELFQGTYMVNGTPFFNGVILVFTGPDGVIYNLGLAVGGNNGDIRQLQPTEAIRNAPIAKRIKGNHGIEPGTQQGIIVTAGTPIMIATAKTTMGIGLRAFHPEDVGYGWKIVHPNVNLLKNNDGKLLYLSNQPLDIPR